MESAEQPRFILANKGHKICVGYRVCEANARAVVERIQHAGGKAIAIQADISGEEQIISLFKKIGNDLGPISGLVNNAGLLMPQSSIEQLSAQRLAKLSATMAAEASSAHEKRLNGWHFVMVARAVSS